VSLHFNSIILSESVHQGKNEEHYSQFLTDEEPFHEYMRRKRLDGVHGNHVEIQAISELYNRPVEVYTPENGVKPINIFHTEYKTSDHPIRLSYHDGNHYNAVIDPYCPTAGLGLGLPGLKPGLADEMQLKEALIDSDRLDLDRLYVEKAIRESEQLDLDRIYVEKALRESENQVGCAWVSLLCKIASLLILFHPFAFLVLQGKGP
jgi:OTU domain-containing protein 5